MFEVHEALDRFAEAHPQKAELVKLRYFVGLTLPEAAEVLGWSLPTAERRWAAARVWLYREINRQRGVEDSAEERLGRRLSGNESASDHRKSVGSLW
jgi:DNA-directed RNA polymerase specialized sigma24 family protein